MDTPSPPEKVKRGNSHQHTVASLRLDIPSAMEGKTWLLLPEGFRAQECGDTYPLPSARVELQRLVVVPIPANKNDSGCIYLRRAMERFSQLHRRRQSAALDIGRRGERIKQMTYELKGQVAEMKAEARRALDSVLAEADRAIASLSELFELGRKGLDGQMRAHLADEPWKGEKIDAAAFRECFRMVTQAVKGLGLPSDQRKVAAQTIMEQVAESIKATQDAASLAPNVDEETPQ